MENLYSGSSRKAPIRCDICNRCVGHL